MSKLILVFGNKEMRMTTVTPSLSWSWYLSNPSYFPLFNKGIFFKKVNNSSVSGSKCNKFNSSLTKVFWWWSSNFLKFFWNQPQKWLVISFGGTITIYVSPSQNGKEDWWKLKSLNIWYYPGGLQSRYDRYQSPDPRTELCGIQVWDIDMFGP